MDRLTHGERRSGIASAIGRRTVSSLAELDGTPAPIFDRIEVLRRLHESLAADSPIVAAGSSCGLVAKSAEAGGADLIVVYSTGLSRLRGLPTTIFGNPNEMTLAMADEILNVVESTPVICGVEAADPHYTRLPRLLDAVEAAGYSGVINFPTVTLFEPGSYERTSREGLGFGFERELALVAEARDRGLFTMAYVFRPDEAQAMTEVGVDCVVAHVGGTAGGMEGFRTMPVEAAIERVEGMFAAARAVREDVLVLAHGGPFDVAANVERLYQASVAQGFVGASSIERMPIEHAVANAIRSFKRPKAGSNGTPGGP